VPDLIVPYVNQIKENPMKLVKICHLLLFAALSVMLKPQPVFAGGPVDPATLNPPPPPEFNPVCKKVGSGTICTVQFSDPPFAGGSGLICGTGADAYEVFQFQNRSVVGHRYYDQNGNLTRRHFHEVDTGTLSNPNNHVALSFSGRITTLHDLSVPGDITSGTQVLTGPVRVYRPHGGTVIIETGRTVNSGTGDFIRESGPHPFQDYFVFGDTAAVQPLCDALR
jgi:hypothetical protein